MCRSLSFRFWNTNGISEKWKSWAKFEQQKGIKYVRLSIFRENINEAWQLSERISRMHLMSKLSQTCLPPPRWQSWWVFREAFGSSPLWFRTASYHLLPHELGSEWAKQAVWSKWMSEPCGQMSERTSKWPCTYVLIHGCFEPQCSIIASPFVHQAEKKSNTGIRLWSKQRDNGLSLSFFSPPLDGLVAGSISRSSVNFFCPLFHFRIIESCRATEVGERRRDTTFRMRYTL